MTRFIRSSILALAVLSTLASAAAIAAAGGAAPPAPANGGPAAAAATQPLDYWSLVAGSDNADLKVYREANAKLRAPKAGEDRVVFIGDSITENWQPPSPPTSPASPTTSAGDVPRKPPGTC